MTTLAEIEKAADALPIKLQLALLDHLNLNLARHRATFWKGRMRPSHTTTFGSRRSPFSTDYRS
jgi:hypothetical protein